MTRHEQKKNIMSNAKLVGNKQNKHNTGTHLSYAIFFPLCDHHQRNQIKMNFTLIWFYLNVVCQVQIVKKKIASTKRGHLIAEVHNTEVKWFIKPCIVRTNKISKALRQK